MNAEYILLYTAFANVCMLTAFQDTPLTQTPLQELLSQATEILEDVHRLRERTEPPCDVTDILEQLTVALHPFTQTLQALQDIYVAVHIFHLLFQKVTNPSYLLVDRYSHLYVCIDI